MKKIIKIVKNNMIGFTVGVVIAIAISTYAATQLASSSVYYDNTTSGGSSNTVSGAIDELYDMATTHCPDGYICKKPICKRATTLHTEICSQTSTSSYCRADGYTSGDTITYGNLGESGTLASGDAFDCDVNGDGTYDAETERFYYVSDMTNGITSDSDTAVLIYYNNVSGGEANNTTSYAYNTNYSSTEYYGPQTAVTQLPTTSQWSNVSLKYKTRDITDELGTIRVTGFSYDGYSARLLTTQEIEQGCKITVGNRTKGELSSKCKYLMENTKYSNSSLKTYGSWLETPTSSDSRSAWNVFGSIRGVNDSIVGTSSLDGVRPAIEVLKSDISY